MAELAARLRRGRASYDFYFQLSNRSDPSPMPDFDRLLQLVKWKIESDEYSPAFSSPIPLVTLFLWDDTIEK